MIRRKQTWLWHVRFFGRVIVKGNKIRRIKYGQLSSSFSLSFIREITTILATVLFTADSNSGFRIRHRFGCDPTGAGHCQGILARFSSDIILDFLIREISISRRDVGCKRDSLLSRLHFHHLSRLIFGRLLLEPRWNPRWTVRASAGM